MDWITDGIAIGGVEDILDHERLRAEGIDALLQIYGHPRELVHVPIPLTLLQLQMWDREPLNADLLRQGVDFIAAARKSGLPLLVACGAGVSRSPALLAAYLHESGMDLTEAFTLIRQRRWIHPHRELVRSLIDYYGLPLLTHDILERL